MDVLIISMMSLKNSFVWVFYHHIGTSVALSNITNFWYRYMQFHPFAYIVKLNIESKG